MTTAAMLGFVRWCLRRFAYVRELEQRNERLELILNSGFGLKFRPASGSKSDVEQRIDLFLAQSLPLGLDWRVNVRLIQPGVCGVDVDIERKAGS